MYNNPRIGLVRTVDPTSDPITPDEVKQYLRLEISDDDALITSLISAATSWAETYTGRAFLTQTWKMTFDQWFCDQVIRLPWQPLQTVTNIKYLDLNNVLQTLSTSAYNVDSLTSRVQPVFGTVFPIVKYVTPGAIRVTYVAGYGNDSSSVPSGIKQAIKYLAAHWYENRMPVIASGAVPQEVPFTVESLLTQHRTGEIY